MARPIASIASIALLLSGLLSLSALAFERPFPTNALRGKMTPGYFPDVTIDGKVRQLSPAARIFNQDNMIEMPACCAAAISWSTTRWTATAISTASGY